MRLGEKRRRLQSPILAFAHDPLHVLLRDLQVLQQDAFKLVRAIRVLGYFLHPVQRQGGVSFQDGFPKRCRPSKVSVRQLFNLSNAEFLSTERDDEVFDILLLDAIHAHELPQRVHVRIDGKVGAEDLLAHGFAHLADQADPHTHPGLAPGQLRSDLGDRHRVLLSKFLDESRLLQYRQCPIIRNPQQMDDRQGLVLAQRHIRRHPDSELRCASIAFKAVQQNRGSRSIHPFQGFLDAVLRDRSQKPRLDRRILHPIAFVPPI
jgi:hypothetical protein